jgi:hypothetical protein
MMANDSANCPAYKRTMDRAHPLLLLAGVGIGWLGRAWWKNPDRIQASAEEAAERMLRADEEQQKLRTG